MRSCVLILVFLLSTVASLSAQPAGTLKDPHKEKGPQGSWVTNGHWSMKLHSVKAVDSLDAYLALPWTGGLKGEKKSAHLDYMKERVFGAKKQVILVDLEAKNLGDVRDFSRGSPLWKLRTDSATTVGPGIHHQEVAMDNLKGGLPSKGKLKNGETGRGILVFHVPDYAYPTTLFFESLRHSKHGETQSLVLQISAPADAKPLKSQKGSFLTSLPTVEDPKKKGSWKLPYQGKGPLGAWVSNGHWMIRITAVGDVLDQESYLKLPWNKRMDEKTRKKHFSYTEKHVFVSKKNRKKQRASFLKVEAKNLNDQKMEFGIGSPPWRLKVSNREKPVSTGLHHQGLAIWCLEGGIPKKTILNKGAKGDGILMFYLSEDEKPLELYFDTLRHSKHGETGSLVITF